MALTLEDYDKAVFNSSKVIEMAPDRADGYNIRGLSYVMKGDLDKAILDLNKALEIDPLNDQAYNSRGIAWSQKGDYTKACHDWKRACELGGECGNYALAKTKWCK
jgi:tetratricopeptide (TPR) repeat protein